MSLRECAAWDNLSGLFRDISSMANIAPINICDGFVSLYSFLVASLGSLLYHSSKVRQSKSQLGVRVASGKVVGWVGCDSSGIFPLNHGDFFGCEAVELGRAIGLSLFRTYGCHGTHRINQKTATSRVMVHDATP